MKLAAVLAAVGSTLATRHYAAQENALNFISKETHPLVIAPPLAAGARYMMCSQAAAKRPAILAFALDETHDLCHVGLFDFSNSTPTLAGIDVVHLSDLTEGAFHHFSPDVHIPFLPREANGSLDFGNVLQHVVRSHFCKFCQKRSQQLLGVASERVERLAVAV